MFLPEIIPGVDLFQGPSTKPPLGVVPDFYKQSPLIDFSIAISAIFIPVMYILLGIRLYISMKYRRKWMLDDSEKMIDAGSTKLTIRQAS